MNIKKGLVAAAIGTGVALSATACGPGGGYNQAQYCVDQMGNVEPSYYCNGNGFYGGHHYYMFLGNLHGHSYGPGSVIPRQYFSHGSRIDPGNSAARQKAGLPASGAFKNGASVPARSQSGPARSGSSSKVGTFGGSTKSGGSSTFGGGSKSYGGGSSSRIGGFSGGRK